jgi:hypothetical protein
MSAGESVAILARGESPEASGDAASDDPGGI